MNFKHEEGRCEHGHKWKPLQGRPNFLSHLVFEVLGVFESVLVEYENVRQRRKYEINDGSKNPEQRACISQLHTVLGGEGTRT